MDRDSTEVRARPVGAEGSLLAAGWRFMRCRNLCGAAVVAIGALAWIGCAQSERHLRVGGDELGSSLSRATHAHGGRCTLQPGHDWWWCEVEVDVGTIGARYVLRTDASGCWHAFTADTRIVQRRVNDSDGVLVRVVKAPAPKRTGNRPSRASGCVDVRDRLSPDDFSFDDAPPQRPLPLRESKR